MSTFDDGSLGTPPTDPPPEGALPGDAAAPAAGESGGPAADPDWPPPPGSGPPVDPDWPPPLASYAFDPTLGPPGSPTPADAPARKRRFTPGRIVLGVVGLLLVFAVIASFITLPYYALIPGSAQDVAPLITVPKSLEQNHPGTVSLVDVEESQVRLIDWVYFELDPQATIYSSAAIQGPETNAQFDTEGVLDMSDAEQAAIVVALRELGYKVAVVPNGALIYALDPGSPADTNLLVGDVITGLENTLITSPEQVSAALSHYGPGEAVTLTVRPYQSQALKRVSMHLGVWRRQGSGPTAQLVCVPTNVKSPYPVELLIDNGGQLSLPGKGQTGHPVGCLGILDLEPSYHISQLPFPVNLNSEGIVGPSAGLAFTLGLMQKLDTADLTGGMKMAATGTMDIEGQVGEIGGIKQKTYAVRAAGDKIFLVPPGNYKDALHYAGSSLKVYSVSTIGQALSVLERYGGKIEKPPPAP